MGKEETILSDIQNNTSEFNIKFHLTNFAARSIYAVFSSDENKENIKGVINSLKHNGPNAQYYSELAISHMLNNAVSQYLSEEM